MHVIDSLKADLEALGYVYDERGTGGSTNAYETVFFRIEFHGPRLVANVASGGAFPRYTVTLIVRYGKDRLAQEKRLYDATKAVYPLLVSAGAGQLTSESAADPGRQPGQCCNGFHQSQRSLQLAGWRNALERH